MDNDEYLAVIDRIYEAALDASAWQDALCAIAEIFDSKATIFHQDMESFGANLGISARHDPAYIESFQAYYSKINPWMRQIPFVRPRIPNVYRDSDFPNIDIRDSEFHAHWLKPQGLLHTIGSSLAATGPITTYFKLLRSEAAGPYSTTEAMTFGSLTSHIKRSFTMHRRLRAGDLRSDAMAEGLAKLGVAVMVVESDGTLLSANPAADRILSRGDGLIARQGSLRAVAAHHSAQLAKAVGHAASPGGGNDLPIAIGRTGGGSYSVMVCPFRPPHGPIGLPAKGAAIMFVSEPAETPICRSDRLRRFYGITPSESRLLKSMVEGLTVAQHADQAGISLNTARTQLKSLQSKLGANRQSELIRRVLSDRVAVMADKP